MKPHLINRKVHYWAAVCVALPAVVILSTGILLQLKKNVPWVQPVEHRGEAEVPTVSFEQILASCRSVAQAEIQDWGDVHRIDLRPSRGMMKVTAKNNWEIQLDSGTGKVLQVAFRRSDIIESMHDGSWFHEAAKLWLFLPAGITLLAMWVTGIYLFWLPIGVRRRKRRALLKQH
jgi:uncharacterized iron-regulated membrane protein